MIGRLLPREEWSRLPSQELLEPDSQVYVVEHDGEIVACGKALRVTHLEGLWIAPEYRGNAGLGRRLIRGAKLLAARWPWVWAGADTECMRNILKRLGGVRLKLDSYVLREG